MRTLIAIPCMDMVHTAFMASLLAMRRPEDSGIHICSSSLIYDSRNGISSVAIARGFDRILWLDSDMKFGPDLYEQLARTMEENRLDIVSGLYFSRKQPVRPCAYSALEMRDGVPTAVPIDHVPDGPEKVAGFGFGAVLMSAKLLRDVYNHTQGLPFSPRLRWGEDLSFCMAASELGYDLWIDGRIRPGHVGNMVYDASAWEAST